MYSILAAGQKSVPRLITGQIGCQWRSILFGGSTALRERVCTNIRACSTSTYSFFILSHVVLYSLNLTPIPLSFSDAAFITFERVILSRGLSLLRGLIQLDEGETQFSSSQIKTEANGSLTTAMP